MRVATLQFAPKLGEISGNIDRANALLSSPEISLKGVDLLVLPELAFSGYNHPSLAAIAPFLEPTCSGPSAAWAKATAATFKCVVSVGYPELCTSSKRSCLFSSHDTGSTTVEANDDDNDDDDDDDGIVAYNSTVTVSPDGQILAHYRKTHLYYTDETWAKEGPEGFTTTQLTFLDQSEGSTKERRVAWGICMDLNPYKFQAPWDKYEFVNAAIASNADIVVVSTAWLTSLSAEELKAGAKVPDMHTFSYWGDRLRPLIEDSEKEVVVVVANRCGEEPGGADHLRREGVRYAGSSWVGTVGKGKIVVWKMLGRAEEGILVADLVEEVPKYTFELAPSDEDEEIDGDGAGHEPVNGG